MKLRTTGEPWQSWRDGKWYVIVQHDNVVEHIVLLDGTDRAAVEAIALVLGISEAMAKRAVEHPREWITARPVASKPKRRNPGNTPVMRALTKAAKR